MRWRFFSANGGKELNFNRQVGDVSAQIMLKENDLLSIRSSEQNIPLPWDSNFTYEINLTNTPPAELANIDHFLMYYDILEEELPRYIPVMASKAAFTPEPSPCVSSVFPKLDLNVTPTP